jgi:tripartite-type tricarboxylate transporter receptor subunit TctC
MTRPLRIKYDGALYHVTSRGNDREDRKKGMSPIIEMWALLGVPSWMSRVARIVSGGMVFHVLKKADDLQPFRTKAAFRSEVTRMIGKDGGETVRFKIMSLSAKIIAAGICIVWLFSGQALSQAQYYQGKTITIIRGGEPGGSGDMQARALIPFLRRNIPGESNIIIENMPGAAGMKAVNHIYSSAKPDGLAIASAGTPIIVGPILGTTGARYDLDKLIFLGSTESGDPYVFLSRREAGLDNLEKLRAASGIRIGAQTVGHSVYNSGRMFAYLMGLKDPRFVVGFGGPELDIALVRGEIDARANSADTVAGRNRDALEKGAFHIHATITIPRGKFHPRFANVPELDTFTKNEKERQLVHLFRSFLYLRWPYVLPPATPPEIVKTLRAAMAKAFNDPDFAKEFKKLMGSDPTPLTGEQMDSALRELPRDPATLALYKKMTEHDPLPTR